MNEAKKQKADEGIRQKKKKPRFIRKDAHKKKKLAKIWRRPKGLHNKMRLKKKGHAKQPSPGYRAPVATRGYHKSGLFPVMVSNIKQLNSVTKEQGALISSKIGDKKRKMLVEEVKKKGLVLLNLDADKTLARIDSQLKQKQEERRKKDKKKEEKKKGIEEKVKKAEEKKKKVEEKKKEEGKQEEISDEEKKKLEKQEKDKLLTKKS